MQRIHKHLEKRGVPLAAAQVQYSLLSRGPQQEETRAACQDLGVQMIAYSPLALGMLSGKPLDGPVRLSWTGLSCISMIHSSLELLTDEEHTILSSLCISEGCICSHS